MNDDDIIGDEDDDDVEVVCKSKHGTGRPRRPHCTDRTLTGDA